MHVGRYQLIVGVPFFLNLPFVSCTDLVVEDVKVDLVPMSIQTTTNGVVRLDLMLISFGFEGTLKDGIAVTVISNHM